MHDLYDPDGEGQVNDHGDQEQQQEEVQASFPPAVQPHRVGGAAGGALQMQGLRGEDELLLGDLENKHLGVSCQEQSHMLNGYYRSSSATNDSGPCVNRDVTTAWSVHVWSLNGDI